MGEEIFKCKEIFSLTVPATGKPIFAVIKGEAADIIKENQLGLVCSPDNKIYFWNSYKQKSRRKKNLYKKFLTNSVFKKEVIY